MITAKQQSKAHSVRVAVRERIAPMLALSSIFLFLVSVTALSGVFSYTRGGAQAATSSTLNFQARLLANTGQTVADGSYNIRFNLYTVASGGTTQWTETRAVSATQGVTVKNGYFSVSLGEVTAFPGTIAWDQEQWLGMTVQGTNNCTFDVNCSPLDAEMTPRFKLAAVPYAFRAGALMNAAGTTSFTADNLVQVGPGTPQAINLALAAIRLNQTGAGGLLQLQNTGSDVFTVAGNGNTVVAGTATVNGAQFTNNGATLNNTLNLGNFAASGAIGSAATTVDIKTSFVIPQTTAAINLTLPSPTTAAAGRIVYVSNSGTNSFTLNGNTVATGTSAAFVWNGTAWALAGGGAGGADTLQSAYDNSTGAITTVTATDGAVRIRDAATTFANNNIFALQNNAGTIDYLGVQGDGDLAVDTNTLFVDALNNRIGIGTATPTATLQVTTATPAVVATATGTAQVNVLNLLGGIGGSTTIATTGTGGAGGAVITTSGAGGQATAAATASNGGAGGAITYTTGAGGAAAVAGTGNNTGGVAGALTLTGGTGGAATGATSGTNTGGAGGLITLQAGTGGAATTGSGNLVGGAGGALTLRAGTGGVGTTSGGAGGATSLQGGTAAAMAGAAGGAVSVTAAAGSVTGSGGAGGALTLSAGAAGGNNTVNRAGGAVSITAGGSLGATAGGTITITAGSAGSNLAVGTATGATSGGITFNAGSGGIAPNATTLSTGGVAGGFTVNGGTGGAASVAGTGNNTGGGGGTSSFTGGTGGAANGATTGTNAGGVGGNFTFQGGTGGAATTGTGILQGGTGGALSFIGGTGGVGTTGGGGGAISIQGGATAAVVGAAGGGVTISGTQGSITGSGGAGGVLTLQAGNARGDGTVSRAGGALSLTAGNSLGGAAGGAVTVSGGAGGTNATAGTANGGASGGITFNGGNGGTAPNATVSSTGGASGGFTVNGGTGGTASVAGTGNNTGGAGGAFNLTSGTGGNATGATSGINTGGAGGLLAFTAGNGGNATTGTGTLQGGNGGALAFSAGRGGTGTATGVGGDITFSTTPNTAALTERLRVTNTGYVGIGTGTTTSLPNARLTVVAENTTTSQIKLRSARAAIVANNVLGGIDFDTNDSTLTAPGATSARIQAIATATHTGTVNDTAILFSTANGVTLVERWRINATGELQSNGASTIRSNTGDLTLSTLTSGNIIVDGAGVFTVLDALNVSGTQQTINSSTVYTPQAIANDIDGGNIGASAAATVDVDSAFILTQTTAGQTMTLFSPTSTVAGRLIYVTNSPSSTASFTLYGVTLAAGATQSYVWNGTAWTSASAAGAGGVTIVGTIDSQPKSANGAVISGPSLFLQTADATNPGLVGITAQTFGGNKTFNGQIIGTAGLSVNGAPVVINTTGTATTGIGNATGALTIIGSNASTFVINGVTVSATEFNLLDGRNAALVDTNDAVATAITGTGALTAGSIGGSFGSINIGTNTFTGNGSGLTNLNGANISGASITGIDATNISTGTLDNARLSGAISFGTSVTTPVLTSTAALAISSGGTSALSFNSANNIIIIDASDTTLQRTAAGDFTIDLASTGATNLVLTNSAAGVASLNIAEGNLLTGGTTRITNGGVLQNIAGLTIVSGGANITGASSFADATNLNGNVIIGDAATDRLTITSQILGTNALIFQGTTDDTFTTTVAISNPTTNNTITLTDASGTILLLGSSAIQADASTNASIAINKTGASGNILTLQKNAVGVFTIANDGATLVQLNSATAFNVRNSGGTDQFIVDSTNSLVRVGSATVDDTATVLITDTKNTSGDPTGAQATNGAQYYNSFWQQYRCYRDTKWETCGINPIERAFVFNEDFISGYTGTACTTATALIGDQNWTCFINGTATIAYNVGTILPTADRPGIVRMTTAAVTDNGFTIALAGDNSGSVVIAPQNRVKAAVGQGATITNNRLRVGLHNQTTTNAQPLSGVWWEADATTNALWRYCFGTGAVATCANATGFTIAANTLYSLDIQVTATGAGTSAATFTINGTAFTVSGVTIDTTNRVNPAISCYNSTNAARECFADYYQFSGVAATRR